MSFSQLLSILAARKRVVIWVFLVTVIVTTVTSFLIPKTYTATASLVVNSKSVDQVTGLMLPTTSMPGYMATQKDIILSRNVALKVVDALGIAKNPLAIEQFEKATNGKGNVRNWYADEFLKKLDVEPSRESSVIDISYQGADPQFAAGLANAFADAYINTSLQLKIEPAKQVAKWFDQQAKNLRQNVEQAQAKLSAYQKEHEIAYSDDRLDVEAARLNELSTQLVMAQSQTYDSNSKSAQTRGGKLVSAPETLSNGLIQSLKSQLAQAEAKFSDVSQRLGVNHPLYQAALGDVTNLRNLIATETAKTGSSVSQIANTSRQKESEIKAALATQKSRVLKLKSQHDEMAVLVREVENAQRIYDSALSRFGQTNLEGQSVQTDISVLNPAVAPISHSSPRIKTNILLSVFLGSLLAVIFALIVELLDRKVRIAEDITKMLNLPVLAELYSDGQNQGQSLSLFKNAMQFFAGLKNKKSTLSNHRFYAK
jgi:polysaccharide biosynthesis transport protein